MLLIIAAWIYCFLLILSIGSGVLKLIAKISDPLLYRSYDIFYRSWFGFAIVVGLLQVLSLFLPMSSVAVFAIVSLIALLCFAINYSDFIASFRRIPNMLSIRGLLYVFCTGAIVFIIAYCANKEVTHPDTFIYHYSAVRWAREYPVVPGLVNLHGRLGFNSSFFLFAAFTEQGTYAGYSAHTALSFLLALCVLHWCYTIVKNTEPFAKRTFCMMTLPFVLYHIAVRMDIASLSTDYPMAVITLICCLVLLDKVKYKVMLLLPLAAVVFTFKLSGMLIVAIALLAAVGNYLQCTYGDHTHISRKHSLKITWTSLSLLFVIITGFIVRNIIVSGWLLYPFPIGNLHLPWSTPKPYVQNMISWIKDYPKIPGGTSPDVIQGNGFFYWFTPWYERFKLSNEFYMLVASVALIAWSFLQVKPASRLVYGRSNNFLVLGFSVISILFWITSAPDLRFGSVNFFILFGASVALLASSSAYPLVMRAAVYLIFIHQLGTQLPAFVFDRKPYLFTMPYTKQPEVKKVVGSPQEQNPPFYLYMPVEGNQCGNAPLPCTPYAGGLLHHHQTIKQRVPGDVSSGFLSPQ